jgi:hypothetical protein
MGFSPVVAYRGDRSFSATSSGVALSFAKGIAALAAEASSIQA